MATRINLMKMLQEVRGLAELTNRHRQAAQPVAQVLALRPGLRRHSIRPRRTLRISIQDGPDIPTPVPITLIKAPATVKPS